VVLEFEIIHDDEMKLEIDLEIHSEHEVETILEIET
jgi:hypothetical protein